MRGGTVSPQGAAGRLAPPGWAGRGPAGAPPPSNAGRIRPPRGIAHPPYTYTATFLFSVVGGRGEAPPTASALPLLRVAPQAFQMSDEGRNCGSTRSGGASRTAGVGWMWTGRCTTTVECGTHSTSSENRPSAVHLHRHIPLLCRRWKRRSTSYRLRSSDPPRCAAGVSDER